MLEQTLTVRRRALMWTAILGGLLFALWWLSPVLFPFLAGLVIAYILDPAVDRAERWNMSRTVATTVVMALFFIAVALFLLLLAPLLYDQLRGLSRKLTNAAEDLYDLVRPYIDQYLAREAAREGGETSPGVDLAGQALGWLGGLLGGLWSGGIALFNVLSLIFVTPIVVFYLLRDWDRIVATVDLWLPRDHAPVIRAQLQEIDRRMSGFLRGQALVCVLLGVFYAVGLTLTGLSYGLIIGLVTGLVSFIPYFGMLIGAGIGLLVAFFQFENWWMTAAVAGVFMLGQILEGNFVSPILVGDRVGLHPVWVMLALLAGGALFGFIGLLVAVPAAAAIGVVLEYALERYLKSPLYRGEDLQPSRPPDKAGEY